MRELSAQQVKVLVVDDDPSWRATLSDWLAQEGHEVHEATDGLDAFELARWEAFDVVVTDLQMPHLDGLALLARLETLVPDVRVIFVSGTATMADAVEALREGRSFDFLEKPLPNLERLSRAIARSIERRPLAPHPGGHVPISATGAHPVLEHVFAFVQAHLAEPIGLPEVAEAVGYSPAYLTALVRETTGQPVMQWVTSLRLTKARRLLRDPALSLAEIASSVGIPDAKYFSRLFKRAYGVPPQTWRALDREAQGLG